MADRPILFSGPMIKALLAGTKSQTRRMLTPQPEHLQVYDWKGKRIHDSEYRHWCWRGHVGADNWDDITTQLRPFLPAKAGGRLWVTEKWTGHWGRPCPGARIITNATIKQKCGETYSASESDPLFVYYAADIDEPPMPHLRWKSPRFMPKWASRITLLVDDVKVERLQDISEEDAIAEGITRIGAEYIARGSKNWDAGPNFYTVDLGFGNMNDATAVDVYRRLWEWINGEGSWAVNPWVVAYSFKVVIENIDYIGKAAA